MLQPISFTQITNLAAAQNLPSIPVGENAQVIAVVQAEGQSVRWRVDGQDPTATVGNLLQANTERTFDGSLSNLRFIEASAGAILNVNYYRQA